jgi:hypothetical protein
LNAGSGHVARNQSLIDSPYKRHVVQAFRGGARAQSRLRDSRSHDDEMDVSMRTQRCSSIENAVESLHLADCTHIHGRETRFPRDVRDRFRGKAIDWAEYSFIRWVGSANDAISPEPWITLKEQLARALRTNADYARAILSEPNQ